MPKPSVFPRLIAPDTALVIVCLLLIAAFGLRVWNLNEPSVWHDEGWSIRAVRDPIDGADDKTPFVYYGLIHLLWTVAGDTPFAMRYGSALLDVITIALVAHLVRQWASWDAAILAVVLLGVSPLMWAYAREIRAYVGVPLLTVLLLWGVDRLLARHKYASWRVWIVVLFAELTLLYTHNLSVPVVAWLNIMIGGVWGWQREWRWLAIWIAGQAALLIAYLPWVLDQPISGTPINSPPELGLALIWDIWRSYFAPLPTLVGAENALDIGGLLFAVVAILSLAAVINWRWDRRAQLVISQALLLPVLVTIELIIASIDFHPRYFIASVPATMILIALGVECIPDLDQRRIMIPAAMALATGVGATGIFILLDDPKYQHDDFRAVSEYYARLPEDMIILIPYGWEPALEVYYAEKTGIRAEMLGIDLHSSADEAIEQINAAIVEHTFPVEIELMTWYQLPADLRGMYPCLLESAGRRTDDPVFTVQGITTSRYEIERPLALTEIPIDSVEYGEISLTGAAQSGPAAICVQTQWALPQITQENLRVSGRVLTTDPPGWIIARSDTDIRADDQTPTSMWEPGDQGMGYSLLRFPTGAPPVEYVIQLVVFSNTRLRGLDRLVNGVPSGKMIELTTVTPQGTTDAEIGLVSQEIIAHDPQIEFIGTDATGETLNAGQELRITLHWRAPEGCCATEPWTKATLALRGEDWAVAEPVQVYSTYSQDWHALRIPAEAHGSADLVIESDEELITLATYTIEETDRLFALPAFAVAMQTDFSGLALLEGFSVANPVVSPDETLDLTLVWRVTHTPETSYRVFTHLLDPQNRVIAQHDGYPVNGTRLTPSWIPDEYIVDPYALEFDPEFADYRGPARLEVGFYDPETGNRIRVANGADHVILPIEITVQ
ncbi:MAG: hypothetical protein JXA10_00055 [Anaerolineae bacterium]|nr:hypothetical protein [Anaerolineae bacterium]